MRGQNGWARFQRPWPERPWRHMPSVMACQIGPWRFMSRTSGISRVSIGDAPARSSRTKSFWEGGLICDNPKRVVLAFRRFILIRPSPPRGGALHALQLLQNPLDVASHASDGSWIDRSRLGD